MTLCSWEGNFNRTYCSGHLLLGLWMTDITCRLTDWRPGSDPTHGTTFTVTFTFILQSCTTYMYHTFWTLSSLSVLRNSVLVYDQCQQSSENMHSVTLTIWNECIAWNSELSCKQPDVGDRTLDQSTVSHSDAAISQTEDIILCTYSLLLPHDIIWLWLHNSNCVQDVIEQKVFE